MGDPRLSLTVMASALALAGFACGAGASPGPSPPPQQAPVKPEPEPVEPDAARCSAAEFEFCLNGVSASVTSLDSLRVTGERVSARRSEATEEDRAAARGRTTGLAAGEGFGAWSVWASYSRSSFESDVRVAPFDADLDSALIGADTLLGERLVVGLAAGYEATDADTQFNAGGQDTDGFTVAPYVAWLINDTFSVDLSAGYSTLSTDSDRVDPANGARLTADFDSERGFVTANLNGTWLAGRFVIGARVGMLHSGEIQDGYTEAGGPSVRTVRKRHVDLTQGYVGGDVAYALGAWEPYVTAVYRNDFASDDGSGAGGLPNAVGSTQPDDDDEFQLGLGVRYFGKRVTGSFEWLTTEGREDFEDDTFTLTLRLAL